MSDIKIGDIVNCNLCFECSYQLGDVVEDYGLSVLVNWGFPGGESVWAKTDLKLSTGVAEFSKDIKDEKCRHDYKSYFGINEQFNYCIKCDEKKT